MTRSRYIVVTVTIFQIFSSTFPIKLEVFGLGPDSQKIGAVSKPASMDIIIIK